MFTGLVEHVGTVVRLDDVPGGLRLRIEAGRLTEDLTEGASIAVDGACLTATNVANGAFDADVSPETIEKTCIVGYSVGTPVNLERSLRASDRMGGHFVLGHVDGTGRLIETAEQGAFVLATFAAPDTVRRFLVDKGCVALNGVSLTVATLREESFDVQLVPHTLERTNLLDPQRAPTLNVEADILGKYVQRLLPGSKGGFAGGESAD